MLINIPMMMMMVFIKKNPKNQINRIKKIFLQTLVMDQSQVCFNYFYFSFLIVNVDGDPIDKIDQDNDNAPDDPNETENQPNNNENIDEPGSIPNANITFVASIYIHIDISIFLCLLEKCSSSHLIAH